MRTTKEGNMWAKLTLTQKVQAMKAYEESEDPSKLIAHEEVLKDL